MYKQTAKWMSALAKLVASASLVVVGFGTSVSAQEASHATAASGMQLASVNLADLETAFWVCEYAASKRGTAGLANCAAVYDALKTRKFDGDFDSLLKWWHDNRESAFGRLAVAEAQFVRGQ